MRGTELLDKMELIDPVFVEAAEAAPQRTRSKRLVWGSVAACFVLLIGLFAAVRSGVFPGLQSGITAILPFNKPQQPYSTMQDYTQAHYPAIRSAGTADFMQYDYANLFRYAHTVAVVTPLDDLTAENTYGVSESGDRYYNIHSVREVKAITYFKNEKEYGDTFTLAEECGVLADGTLVTFEDCWPMQKGDTYLVFLCKSGFGYPISVSGCNGKFDLTHLDLNCRQHSKVLLTALLELNLLTEKSVQQAGDVLQEAASALPVYWPEDEEHIAKETAIEWKTFELYTRWTDKSYPLKLKRGTDEDGVLYSYLQNMLCLQSEAAAS